MESSSIEGNITSALYATCYVVGIFIISIWAYKKLLSENQFQNVQTKRQNLKRWFTLVRAKHSMYFVAIIHIFHTATDIGVLIDWYQIGLKQRSLNDTQTTIYDINVCVKLSYNLIASAYIYFLTRNNFCSILQLFDLALFEMIKLNWIWNFLKRVNHKYLYKNLRLHIYESFGQSLLQLVFLWKTYGIFENKTNLFEYYFVFISFLFSIISMSQRFISDDKIFFDKLGKEADFHMSTSCNDDTSGQRCGCISRYWAIRVVWRILEVGTAVIIDAAIWVYIGGMWLIVILTSEIALLSIINIFIIKNRWEFVEYIIISPIIISHQFNDCNGRRKCIGNLVLVAIFYTAIRLGYVMWLYNAMDENHGADKTSFLLTLLVVILIILRLQILLINKDRCLTDIEPTSQRLNINQVILSRNVPRLDEWTLYGLYFK